MLKLPGGPRPPQRPVEVCHRGAASSRERCAGLPGDLGKEFPQARPLCSVDRLDKTDSARQMGTEISMSRAVLALPAVTDAVGQYGLQPIEFFAADVQPFISHQAGQMLAHSPTHDSRFVVIHS